MRSQAAFALLQGAKEIRVALVAAGLRIAGLLTERYPPPVVRGRPLFDYGDQVRHLIHELETAERKVVAAEDAHMKQEVRVSRLRTERDHLAEVNYDKLVAARQGLDGLQGSKGGFETVYVSGTAPKAPRRLVEQMAQSVTLLDEPAVEPRTLKVAGFNVDYATVARDLESGMLELRGNLDQLDEELKLAEGTMLARREAVDELRSTVIWAGRSAEGLFHRAGESELAKRIRSSTRRPLRPSEEAAAEEKAADESSSDEASPAEQAVGESSPVEPVEPASEPVSGEPEAAGESAQTDVS